MTVTGLVCNAGNGYQVIYTEDAMYTQQTATGMWHCMDIGVSRGPGLDPISREDYAKIMAGARGERGTVDLAPALKVGVSLH